MLTFACRVGMHVQTLNPVIMYLPRGLNESKSQSRGRPSDEKNIIRLTGALNCAQNAGCFCCRTPLFFALFLMNLALSLVCPHLRDKHGMQTTQPHNIHTTSESANQAQKNPSPRTLTLRRPGARPRRCAGAPSRHRWVHPRRVRRKESSRSINILQCERAARGCSVPAT